MSGQRATGTRSAAGRRLDRVARQVDEILGGAPRPGKWTIALMALGMILSVVELLFDDFALPVFVGFAAAIAIGAVLFRRSQPLVALTVVLVARGITIATSAFDDAEFPQQGTFPQFVASLIVAYSAARWIERRHAGPAVAAAMVTVIVGAAFVGGNYWLNLLAGAIGWSIIGGLGIVMRVRAGRADQRLDQVRQAERHDLARELHDVVAHHVSAIAIQADVAKALQSTNPEKSAEAIESIRSTATEALTEMRRIVGALRDGQMSEPATLHDRLHQLVDEHPGSPQPTLIVSGELATVPATIAAAVQRIVQESLTNSRKYARNASFINVTLHRDALGVAIDVENDGDLVAPVEGSAGYGLVGMEERADLLGGRFAAGPRPAGGWRVDAFIPVRNV